jgi:hypothetical protein
MRTVELAPSLLLVSLLLIYGHRDMILRERNRQFQYRAWITANESRSFAIDHKKETSKLTEIEALHKERKMPPVEWFRCSTHRLVFDLSGTSASRNQSKVGGT